MSGLLDALSRGDVHRAALADAAIYDKLRSSPVDTAREGLEALRAAYADAIERCTALRDRLADDVAQGRRNRAATNAYLRHSVT
jgi:hypothetical protein